MKIRIEDGMPLVYLEAKPEEILLIYQALYTAATKHATGKYDRLLTTFSSAVLDLPEKED